MGVFEPDAGNGTIITLANTAAQIKFVCIARTNKSEFYTLTITRCLISCLTAYSLLRSSSQFDRGDGLPGS